jgi:hypothetical protein
MSPKLGAQLTTTTKQKSESVARRKADIESTFRVLVSAWKSRKSHSSSIEEMSMDLAYQQIIGLGPNAVPLLLRELEREPDHWFWALHAITRHDPVPRASRGKISEMAKAWIVWGKQQGYRW